MDSVGFTWGIESHENPEAKPTTWIRRADGSPVVHRELLEGQIRLLQLVSNPEDGPIRLCTLVGPLEHAPRYTAVSYVWGDATETETIYVNTIPFSISKSLAGLIRHFGSDQPVTATCGDATRRFNLMWADALCINQSDAQEKTKQVRMMAAIYQKAHAVMAWLGEDNEDQSLETAIAGIAGIGTLFWNSDGKDHSWAKQLAEAGFWDYENTARLGEHRSMGNPAWDDIKQFLTLPYWSRSWIVQEMVFAKSLYFQVGWIRLNHAQLVQFTMFLLSCKDREISSDDLGCDMQLWLEISRLHYLQETIVFTQNARMKLDYAADPTILEDIDRWVREGEAGIAGSAFKMIPPNYRNAPPDTREAFRNTLMPFRKPKGDLQRSMDLLATDPRDKLFAFYGINACPIIPDYRQDTNTVYRLAGQEWARKGELGSYLNLCGIGYGTKSSLDLPTWVPDWDSFGRARRARTTAFFTGMVRSSPESFSSVFFVDYEGYKAAKGLDDVPMLVSEDGSRLQAAGVICSEAITVYQPDHWKYLSDTIDLSKYTVDNEVKAINPHGMPLLQYMIRTILADTFLRASRRLGMEAKIAAGEAEELARSLIKAFQGIAATEYGGRRNYIDNTFPSYGWNKDEEPFNSFCQRQFMSWLSVGLPGAPEELRLGFTISWPTTEDYLGSDQVSQALAHKLVTKNVESCRIFMLDDGGIGLGPYYMLPGDKVVVISGCNFPILLRQEGEYYRHVGPCFALHLMHGQAAKRKSERAEDMKTFTII
ncbi:HET-domain-containing protein [Thozetella sp. PMI_491]|nr:HET-domain-containing protein [Thozetella sp. PMI_491]